MSVETCWIPVLLWILCGSQLRWTHFDGFPWRDKPFGSMMSDFVGPCWLAHETCQGLYPVSTVCLSQELMMTWLDGGEVIKFHPFSHSKVIYIYIFTFFPVTRVLKVVIPIGCPVGPEVQTLGIFGSNPFYNLIQLIYIYIYIYMYHIVSPTFSVRVSRFGVSRSVSSSSPYPHPMSWTPCAQPDMSE